MKRLSVFLAAFGLLAGSAFAQGEDCSSATSVGSTGFVWTVTGSTVGQADDYDEACNAPFDQVGGVDEVWTYTPASTGFVTLSLCQGTTNYDTKMYVYEGSCPAVGSGATGTSYACNDDNCDNGALFPNPWVSFIDDLLVNAGTTYYIVVDGWGGTDAGNYTLLCNVDATPPSGNDIAQGEGLISTYSYKPNYNVSGATFASVLSNTGASVLTNCVSTLRVFSDADGFVTPIFTDASAPITLNPAAVQVVVGTTPFTPPGNGVYIYEFTASASSNDDITNDVFNAFQVITDTFQERSQAFLGAPLSAVRLAILDPTAEYGVVQSYASDVDVIGATLLVSVDPVYAGEAITANLYQVLGGDLDSVSLVATGSVPADTGILVYDIPLSASITAGDYILTYAGQSFPVRTDFIYSPGASDILRAAVTGGFWAAFAGPYAWSNVLWTADAAPGCNSAVLPSNQSSTNLSNRVQLDWNPQPGAVACQVQGKRLPTGPQPSVNIVSGDISTTNVPYAVAGAGTTWTWRVRCACSISPLDVSAYTAYGDTFSIPVAREADLIEMAMYPNPADNQLMVSFSAESGNADLTVVDMLGRSVLVRNLATVEGQNNTTLDVTGLEPGAYFLRIEDGKGVRVEEFSVAR